MTSGRPVVLLVLGLCVLLSALGVVYSKHRSRELFKELQVLVAQRDDLNIEWGRLMLEQSTWATPSRVEKVARERLGMKVPSSEQVVIVTP